MKFSSRKWIQSAEKAKSKKNLRYCPGVYLPTGEYFDVWLYSWLETTPYKTFEELWESNDVLFLKRWLGG